MIKQESIARIIFIIFAVIICEAFAHFTNATDIDILRFLVILVIFEQFKGELTDESNPTN